MSVEIINEKCVGCKACVRACPFGAIEMQERLAVIIPEKCTVCGACESACKFDAILIRKQHKERAHIGEYKHVWVFCEQKNGEIQSVSYELLGEGRKLADKLGVDLCGVLLGDKIEDKAEEIIWRGANRVYVVDSPELKNYLDEPYTNVLVELIKKHKPEIVLTGASTIGRSLIPRVAVELKTGLTADCTELDIDQEERVLLQTRPAFGGNIMATILCQDNRPQMATVRHKVMKEAEEDKSRKGEIIKECFPAETYKSRTKLIDVVEEVSETVNLSEADIIVSGGRGMQSKENFKLIEELAKTIGGAVGASRGAVDSDWIPYSHQVGQTGKTVCPKIYIACGISGQIQHLIGMQSSDIIIAINKDANAPIFKVATYGLVGDLFEILPKLTAQFKKTLGKKTEVLT